MCILKQEGSWEGMTEISPVILHCPFLRHGSIQYEAVCPFGFALYFIVG